MSSTNPTRLDETVGPCEASCPEAILKLLGGQFFTHRAGDDFSAEFVLPLTPPDAAQG